MRKLQDDKDRDVRYFCSAEAYIETTFPLDTSSLHEYQVTYLPYCLLIVFINCNVYYLLQIGSKVFIMLLLNMPLISY